MTSRVCRQQGFPVHPFRRCLPVLLICLACEAGLASDEWPQFGGPTRNFKASSKGLAGSWPANGPRQLWSRSLGEGHSSIVVDGKTLYTMYRGVGFFSNSDDEMVIALDANTGKTIWEYKYPAPPDKKMDLQFGVGPHSTPLIFGDRLFTVGILGKFLCLDKKTGKVLWSHDLVQEYGGTLMGRGYSSSPLAYKNTVIVTVGGAGHHVIAFNLNDGAVMWKNLDFPNSYASPILITVDGQDQLVLFTTDDIVGVDPNNGTMLWKHAHPTQYGLNISTPVWGEDNLLYCSSAYTGGSRVLKLGQKDGKTTVQELWFSPKMRVHHGTAVRVGDYVYGSSGDFGPAFLTAVDVKSGRILWQERTFPKASFVYADGKFIVLDEDGNLSLATFSAEGLKVHSKVELLRNLAWTAPTLVDSRLYIRDRRTMMALDLR